LAEWSLSQLLSSLHEDIQHRLSTARKSFKHPGTKGDASEAIWIDMFAQYLPERYQVASAHVVDSTGNFSDQIDAVVFDRQYSPFIFTYENQLIVPAESVYAVFEAKQTPILSNTHKTRSHQCEDCIGPAYQSRMLAASTHQNNSFPSSAGF
jgi:hypothetical protein